MEQQVMEIVKGSSTPVLVVIIYILLETLKFAFTSIFSKKDNKTDEMIKEIHSIVTAKDGNGMPLCYVSREALKTTVDSLIKIAEMQRDTFNRIKGD